MTCKNWEAFSLSVCCRGNSIEILKKLAKWILSSKSITWGLFSRLKQRMRQAKIRCGTKVLTYLFSRWEIFWKLQFLMKTTSPMILSAQTNSQLGSFAGTKESMSGSNLTLRRIKQQSYLLKLFTYLLEKHGIKITILSLKVR